MIKVFLVEDEIVMREGIKNNISWEKEGFEFVGEASDGELAYPMIQKLHPDIVITDIRMPFMDGLELSRLVKKEMPAVKIIVLSGYNEFDYAKQAITIGITDYLLKPISPAKLLEAVKKVADKIEAENEQKEYLERFRREMLENEHIERQKFFNELISNKLSMSQILETGKKLDIDLTAESYAIALYSVTMPGEKGIHYQEDLVCLGEELLRLLEGHKSVYPFDRGAEGWAFLVKGENEDEIKDIFNRMWQDIAGIVRKYPQVEYFGGEGKVVRRLRELPEAFDEANKAFSYRYLGGLNRIVHSDEIGQINVLQKDDIDLNTLDIGKIDRRILENFLKQGSQEEIKHFVSDYFESLGKNNVESLLFRQYITMDMYFCTAAFIEDMGHSPEDIVEKCGDFKDVAAVLSTPESTKNYLEKIIAQAISMRDNASMKKYTSLLDKAKAYIGQNYDNEEISLNSVAAHVNISPSHFSTIFSQEMGQTFIEYLTNVRMDRAKELLMCSSKKTSEIGYEVGYKDSHYFSYLFKKTQDCTPKEFRMRGKA